MLEKALTPNDPDSPILREEVIPKKKGLKKKKGMPFYSPLKMDRSQSKKKTTFKHSRKSTSKHAKDQTATEEGSKPSGARRKVDFKDDGAAESQLPNDGKEEAQTEKPQVPNVESFGQYAPEPYVQNPTNPPE